MIDQVDFTRDELRDDAQGCEEDYKEAGCSSCSNCGSFCTSVERHRYFSGVWHTGVPEMLTAEVVTCKACGLIEEV